jgi:hypothetical protein
VESLSLPGCEISYLENERTPGASGAWNTALDFLAGKGGDASGVFVAVLDDDDSWSSAYIERCCATAAEQKLDMVAADLRRFESLGAQPSICEGPTHLQSGDFLTGNPGIQGSNLFLRLSVILAAGGFDEALRSTTDRDLCIRIADLGTVRYGRLPAALVDHFADADRSRLSARGSPAKVEGLAAFWTKYMGRMTADQRQAFSDRAAALFEWRPANDVALALPNADASRKALVLGLFADNDRPEELLKLVRVLGSLSDARVGLDVVLIEQGPRSPEGSVLDEAAAMLRESGVGCFRFALERQHEDSKTGLLSCDAWPHDRTRAEPLGGAAMLSVYCARVAKDRPEIEVWLVEGTERSGQTPSGTEVADILRWLRASDLPIENAETTNAAVETGTALDQWIQSERVATAEHRLRRHFEVERVRLLGCGSEAVVFTDERTVYKCIDHWKTRMPSSHLAFLQGQVDRWAAVPGLYPLKGVVGDDRFAFLTYGYEVSSPYNGGHEPDLIRLLNSCCDVGVVCNNIHPKNLVVTPSGVRLIDYGSDIRPWSPLGFEHMARRAFLTCRHAAHPDLHSLMRRVLNDDRIAEMAGYSAFRARIDAASRWPRPGRRHSPADSIGMAPDHSPFQLYAGVITSDPAMLKPLLEGLASLGSSASFRGLGAIVLDNGSPPQELDAVVRGARDSGLHVAVVDETQQRRDAADGAFGTALRDRPMGQVGIARARTMLQRYLGTLLAADTDSFGWLLDDDMRIDARARVYLPWLPTFRKQGTDVLIGAYEGASPNPPLNGLRVHLVDFLHNLHWLRGLPGQAALPDRTADNNALRKRYPDYYYDLSRKHNGHLEMPLWLEPAFPGETVGEAYSRLLAGAVGLLNGEPLTRPIVVPPVSNPLAAARDSVNRGGCTFVLNHLSLTQTPNMITCVQGREARRSDMVWAIVNRHYRRMTIKAVEFPIHHVARATLPPSLNIEKVQAEIVGSTLYAGLTEFLRTRPQHKLDFSPQETAEVTRMADHHLDRRWRLLEQSFCRIAGLREAIRRLPNPEELQDLVRSLDEWFTPAIFCRIRSGIHTHDTCDIRDFVASLQVVADDFAAATVNIDFIQAQLGPGRMAMTGRIQA